MKWMLVMLAVTIWPAFAQPMSGALVDARCYESMDGNRNPSSTLYDVNRDRNAEIRYCHPGAKTKTFLVIDFNGQSHRLDAAGEAKAAALVQAHPKLHWYQVDVEGGRSGGVLQVSSMELEK